MTLPGPSSDRPLVDDEDISRAIAFLSEALRERQVAPVRLAVDLAADPLLARTEQIYRARRKRDKLFDAQLFGEPAFDILLDLFISQRRGRRVSVTSCCIAAAAPPTTALRHIQRLEDALLIERQADRRDKRRSYVELTPIGLSLVERFFREAP